MFVEMQVAMHFPSTSTNKRVSLSDRIDIDMLSMEKDTHTLLYSTKHVTRFFNERISEVIAQYNKYKSVKNLEIIYEALSRDAMYYLAHVYFLEKYCDDDFTNLIDASMFTDVFGSDILVLAEKFKTDNMTKVLLMDAYVFECGMREKFLAKYGG